MANFDTKVEQLLSTSRLLLNHPGQAQMGSDLYSNVHNSQIEMIRRQAYHGRYKASANSMTLGGSSTFYLQPGTIFNQIYIAGELAVPLHGRMASGWLLKAVDQLNIVVSGNSSIQNLQISGEAHFCAVMATCANSEKRDAIINASPYVSGAAAGSYWGAMPLVLPWSGPELRGIFALDSSTLQSQIAITIRWKPAYMVVAGDTTNDISAGLPNAFNDLYLRAVQVEMLDQQFALSNELASKPALTYSIPSLYYQSFEIQVDNSIGTEWSVSLTSMPRGMLQAILVSFIPNEWKGTSGTQSYLHNYGVDFDSMRMLYNGQELFRYEHREEGDLLQCLKEDGGDGEFHVLNKNTAIAAATTQRVRQKIMIIPFCNEISQVLRERRHEHTKDYSGSSLQLYGTVATANRAATNYIDEGNAGIVNPSSDYTLTVTYVLNSLVEINQRSVSLEL